MENAAYLRSSNRAPKKCGKRARIALFASAAILLSVAIVSIIIEKPLESLADKRVSAAASKLLNDSLREVMDEYIKQGGSVFAHEQSTADDASVLFIDALGMNLMAARVTERAQQKVEELSVCGVDVPLGSASGLSILNGVGPRIPIRIEPIGEVRSRFTSAFESAGVNQTRYKATLALSADIEMILFGKTRSVSASVSAPICETIVIGGVPAAYTNVESMEDALNLIPTDVEGIFDP